MLRKRCAVVYTFRLSYRALRTMERGLCTCIVRSSGIFDSVHSRIHP